ncbi:MAG: universal stress protein [Boseongicola sp.]|nr:universal stress protein [Boseongicola sp.]
MSENALRLACSLAQKYDSELHLVHTPQPHTVAFAMGAVAGYHAVTTMPDPAEVREAAEKILSKGKEIAAEVGCTITETYMDVGDPADEIVACVNKVGADLIVTGRRGLGMLGSLVQGSTSQRINHLATCACLSTV